MGIGSVGGLFCMNNGSWISGFNKTMEIADLLQTEVWGILLGLRLAWENGFEKVLVQSDNKEAIKRLNATKSDSDPCILVRTITKLRNRGWMTDAQWIPREVNKFADRLAKLDNLPNYDVIIFSQPPECLLSLLDFDLLHSL
ncbi:hypothetical protein V6N12_053140 [Hibiscus sabdariffa]|uniref:RNase H type-1 domain-containing protein n=1 Tax=Hibiscus sabdariffa TaxID=183260 RepID=A0ABR2D6P8_9ROSI